MNTEVRKASSVAGAEQTIYGCRGQVDEEAKHLYHGEHLPLYDELVMMNPFSRVQGQCFLLVA